MVIRHRERHRSERVGWLRAAVLGANDGIVSTASLVVGVAAGGGTRGSLAIAAVAGLVAGAMSMAAGEYVSVSSQADAERADLAIERRELAADRAGEREELAHIYVTRGVERALAERVADQMMAYDALGAHMRDELGITEVARARPVQAALASAAAFSLGALLPVGVALVAPTAWVSVAVVAGSLAALGILGAMAARAGGAEPRRGAARVMLWSALAMALTYAIGALVGRVV